MILDSYPIAVQFFVPGKPQPGGSKRGFVTKAGRVAIVEDAKRNKDWRAVVSLAASEAMKGREPFAGPLRLFIEFTLPRPRSHYRTGRYEAVLKPQAPCWHTSKPDSTKLLRSTEDAMTGIVWRDDAQVAMVLVRKRYADGQPGAKITVEEIH